VVAEALDAALGVGLYVGKGVWGAADWLDRNVVSPLDKINEWSGNKDVKGRYDKTWTKLINLDRESDLLRYKKSAVLHWLHDDPVVQRAGRFLRYTHTDRVLEKLGPVGIAIGLVPVGVDLKHAYTDYTHQNYAGAGGDVVDASADLLKDLPWPVAYFAGGTIALDKEAYDLGWQVDWKQSIPNPFNAETFRDDYLPTFKSMPGQVADALVKAYS
jgi:hypothetical protein